MTMPAYMNAMVLIEPGMTLQLKKVPVPKPLEKQVLIRVIACGVCRTDLHIADGELPIKKLPLIPGHEVIGKIVSCGPGSEKFNQGDFVGVAWLACTCGECRYCKSDRENLCDDALFTGYSVDGGYAEYMTAWEDYCFPLSQHIAVCKNASLLCAGLISFRCYRMLPPGVQNIGLYGFGAAAHILAQIALKKQKTIFSFTRKGDIPAQEFAMKLGSSWAGSSEQPPPDKLDAAIIFASAGELIPKALSDCHKGGVVICGGIHMSAIPSFSYDLLWGERMIKSVANLTRKDGMDFFQYVSANPVETAAEFFPLEAANTALDKLRQGRIRGAAVLRISDFLTIAIKPM